MSPTPIRVGYLRDHHPPFHYPCLKLGAECTRPGIGVEIWREFARQMDWKVEFVRYNVSGEQKICEMVKGRYYSTLPVYWYLLYIQYITTVHYLKGVGRPEERFQGKHLFWQILQAQNHSVFPPSFKMTLISQKTMQFWRFCISIYSRKAKLPYSL